MTKAERIEAMARAIFKRRWPDYDYDEHNRMYQAGLAVHPELYMASTTVGNALADAAAALDAADVEGMVRAGCHQAIVAHINRRVGYNEDAAIDAIVRRVCG